LDVLIEEQQALELQLEIHRDALQDMKRTAVERNGRTLGLEEALTTVKVESTRYTRLDPELVLLDHLQGVETFFQRIHGEAIRGREFDDLEAFEESWLEEKKESKNNVKLVLCAKKAENNLRAIIRLVKIKVNSIIRQLEENEDEQEDRPEGMLQ
jgi:hypothetical protein